MPPTPARASELVLKLFEMCNVLVAKNRDDCHRYLFAAIFERAVKDYCVEAYQPNTTNDMVRAPSIIFQHASDWIFSTNRLEFDLTFEFLCESLEINPDGIRKILKQLTEGT